MKKIFTLCLFVCFYQVSSAQWTNLNSAVIQPRGNFYAVGVGDTGYIMSGGGDFGYWSNADIFTTTNVQWSPITNYPGGYNNGTRGFVIGDTIYAGTGAGGGYAYSNTFSEYDIHGQQWTGKTTSYNYQGRTSAVCFTIGDTGYTGGGLNSGYPINTYQNDNPVNDFWRYVPATGVWDSIPHCPARGVGCGAVAFVLNGKAYVGTGGTQDAFNNQQFDPVPDFWCYDPKTNTWDSITPFPGGGRAGGVAFVTCGRAYVGLGCTDGNQSVFANDIWAFDPNGGPIGPNGPMGSWTRISDFSGAGREYAGCFVIGTHAYVMCGLQDGGNITFDDIWEYTPTPAFKFNSPVCQNVQVQLVDTSLFFPEYWAWSFPGGTPDTSNADSVNVIYNTPGTYSVTLTAWNDCDTGTTTYIDSIVVNPGGTLSILATPANSIICNGQTATLSVAGGGANLVWQPAVSIIDSSVTNDTITITPTDTTVYTVTGPGSGGCAYFGTDTVIVKPAYPFTVLPLDTSFCSGQSAILYVESGGSNFVWTPINGITDSTLSGGDSVVVSPTTTTTYTVSGVNHVGCATSGADVVTVIPSPNKPTFSQNGNVLSSSSKNDNQWYRNDTLLVNDTSQNLTITIPGEYWVVVNNEANGCSTSSDSMQIKTGINQLSTISYQLSIYPNPFSNSIFIKINSSAENVNDWNLLVTDVLGRTLYSRQSLNYNNEIDLSNLSSGVYFITVINKTGRAVVPVVKQN